MAEAPQDQPSPEETRRRVAWFHEYTARLDSQPPGLPLAARAAGARHSASAGVRICPVCFWEDDGQDDPKAHKVWGGPNGR